MKNIRFQCQILCFLAYFAFWLSLPIFTACGQPAEEKPTQSDTSMAATHTAQNSIDWSGTYRNILPCADCAGIKTEIRLYKNGIYQMMQKYLGESEEVFIQRGKLKWLVEGKSFQFSGNEPGNYAYKFHLGDKAIWLLDNDGNRIEGSLADKYKFDKVAKFEILGKTWTLKNITNEDISPINFLRSGANLMLTPQSNKANAMGGCNVVQMNYHIDEKERTLQFSNIIRTRKSCPFLKLENSFINALQKVASFDVDTDDLKMYDQEGSLLLTFSYKYFD